MYSVILYLYFPSTHYYMRATPNGQITVACRANRSTGGLSILLQGANSEYNGSRYLLKWFEISFHIRCLLSSFCSQSTVFFFYLVVRPILRLSKSDFETPFGDLCRCYCSWEMELLGTFCKKSFLCRNLCAR